MKPVVSWLSGMVHASLFTVGDTAVSVRTLATLCILILGSWWLLLRLETLLARVLRRRMVDVQRQASLLALIRIARYLTWAALALASLGLVGISLSSLAFLGGALGIGLGFGLQAIFSNFAAGIILLLERSLKVGDYVDLASGVTGRVREISIRYTRVTTNDNVDILVPNAEFVNGRVTNWTFDSQDRRVHIPFLAAYDTDKDQVRDAALAAAGRLAGDPVAPGREAEVWLTGFGDVGMHFELVVWVSDAMLEQPQRTRARFLWELETEMRAAGIPIPFPQRDLPTRPFASPPLP